MFLQMAVAIFLTPYILKFINKEEYGAYSLALSSIQFLALFNFGFGGALGILVSRNNKNFDLVSSYSSIVQSFQILLGIIGFLFGIYVAINFNDFLNFESKNDYSLKIVLIVFSFSFFLTMINQVYSTLLVSYRQIALDNKIGIFTSLFGSILIIVFLQLGSGVIGLSLSLLITQFLTFIISYIRVKKSLPELKIKYFGIDKKDFRDLYKVGLWIFIGSISIFLIEKFDQIVVAKILSFEMVSILVITSKTFELARKLIFTITNNFRPYFGKLLEEKNDILAKSYFISLRQITVVLSIVVASLLVLVNPYFIDIWVSSEFYGGDYVTLFLGLNLVYHSWKLPSRAFLSSHLIVKEQSVFGIVEGIINVITSVVLAKIYGLVGIVAGTFFSGFFLQIIFYGYLLNKKKLESFKEYIYYQLLLMFQLLFFGMLSFFIHKLLPEISNKIILIPIFIMVSGLFIFLAYLINKNKIQSLLAIKSEGQ
jgi:O-antigen/teichoic acid export membrane protein